MKPPVFDPAWPAEVVEIYRNDLREIWEPSLERNSYLTYQNQLRLYFSVVDRYQPQSILDVGSAQATLALLLAERGKEVCAVDIRQSFLDYARSRYEKGNIRFVCANVLETPDLGRFDMLFCNQLIEHVVYPGRLLEALSGYLRPGGILVVSTPNQSYIRSGLPSFSDLGDPEKYVSRQCSAGGEDHFFAYTDHELRAIVERAGLEVLETIFFESPWISGHMKLRYLQGLMPEPFLRGLDRLTLALASRKLAHQMCLVARK